jgi:hypothetical protein
MIDFYLILIPKEKFTPAALPLLFLEQFSERGFR